MNKDIKNVTRSKIKEAAKIEFSEKGYHNTSVSDIISSIGMAQGSFYHYFKNKHSLFKELLQDFVDILVNGITSYDLNKIVDVETYLSSGYYFWKIILDSFFNNKTLALIFLRDAVGIDENLNRIIDKGYTDVIDYTAKHIDYGKNLGIVRKDFSSKIMAMSIIGTTIFIINRYLLDEIEDISTDKLFEDSLKIHLEGIIKR